MAENPTLDTTATIDALRARVAALEAERDRLDCTRREGGDTRHCRLDAKCQRCQSEAERDAITEQCASAERELNRAWQAPHVEAIRVLADLYALVRGECPRLLNEDSGGDAALALRIEAALRAEGEGDR